MINLLEVYKGKIQKGINEAQKRNTDALLKGQASDYASYKHMVGRLQGLNEAETIVREAYDRLTHEDEKDE